MIKNTAPPPVKMTPVKGNTNTILFLSVLVPGTGLWLDYRMAGPKELEWKKMMDQQTYSQGLRLHAWSLDGKFTFKNAAKALTISSHSSP